MNKYWPGIVAFLALCFVLNFCSRQHQEDYRHRARRVAKIVAIDPADWLSVAVTTVEVDGTRRQIQGRWGEINDVFDVMIDDRTEEILWPPPLK